MISAGLILLCVLSRLISNQVVALGTSVMMYILLAVGRLTEEDVLLRWKYVMIFLLANTLACVTCATLLNVTDKRQVSQLSVCYTCIGRRTDKFYFNT